MSAPVTRVALADLQPPASCIASSSFATAAEKLAVGLSRSGLVVVQLPKRSKGQGSALEAGLMALLACGTSALPGCESREWRVGGPPDVAAVEEAYGALEGTARAVLAALCRSSLLRLRSDAFSPMLDDMPLARSSQGSSLLTARAFVDNFSRLTATEHSAVLPLFADPQEEVSERGLLSVFYAQEAVGAKGDALSAMQVKDSEGRWQDVQLGPYEVAVAVGHTLQHATCGLLKPATHRVVGQPFGRSGSGSGGGSSRGRRLLHFELRPRPAAVLDLRSQLEAAGHQVHSRFSPVSVSSLMRQFESLLSPAAKLATPDQQEGAAAHAAWEALQTQKKGKRRSSLAPAAGEDGAGRGRPATRNLLRGSEGPVTRRTSTRLAEKQAAAGQEDPQQAQQAERSSDGGMEWEGVAAAAGFAGGLARRRSSGSLSQDSDSSAGLSAGRRASLEPVGSAESAGALYVRGGRTCIVVDSCLRDAPADCLTLCVRSFTGLEKHFYLNSCCNLGRVFELYCARYGIGLGAVKFLYRGERVFGASTPASLQMKDGAELTAVPESSDRLRQARELGPLFAAVFGAEAAAAVPASQPV